MKLIHVSDVHWRGLSRHSEFKRAFSKMFDEVRAARPDAIVICGDIVHSKTQGISPELIDHLTWWFRSMASICDVHVTLGNHDGNLMNPGRQDAVSPIINAIAHPRIYLHKQSGVYPLAPGFNLCVFSIFDEAGWPRVAPVPGDVNVATYHGSVDGSTTDLGWQLESDLDISFFVGYDFVLLGDIHKHQALAERAGKPWIAYAGSTIMQDYGEQPGKGYLEWDIRSRDDFTVEFRPVEHDREFRTVEWRGSLRGTLEAAKRLPRGSRIRIRSDVMIPQMEVRQLTSELTTLHGASEVVFKDDCVIEPVALIPDDEGVQHHNLRDVDVLLRLFKGYLGETALVPSGWDDIRKLIEGYMARAVAEDAAPRNVRWQLHELWFDNIFGYGTGNHINFKHLSGITGIFGPNRIGKSSIIGTLIYALFNGTDRGAIKNLHVINSRKGHCNAHLTFSVDGKGYRIERQSVRHEARGIQHAVTSLNFYETDQDGVLLRDLNGEQRTDTEKTIRSLVGTADDITLTGIAAQGDINRFIDAGPSYRDQVMTRFLDLIIFEKMSQYAKEDSSAIKAEAKNAPDRDWDTLITSREDEIQRQASEMLRLERLLKEKRAALDGLRLQLGTMFNADAVTWSDVDGLKERLKTTREDKERLDAQLKAGSSKLSGQQVALDALRSEREAIPVASLQEQLQTISALKDFLAGLRQSCEKEKQVLSGQERSVLRLAEVPCGDAFPTCKYIRDSHVDRSRIDGQRESVQGLIGQIAQVQLSLDDLHAGAIEEQLKRHSKLSDEERNIERLMSKQQRDIDASRASLSLRSSEMSKLEEKMADYISRVVNDDGSASLRKSIADLETQVEELDAKRVGAASRSGTLSGEVSRLQEEKEKYAKLKSQWYLYELFIQATSKKGIPSQIVQSQLPLINAEVARILHGVTDFTLRFEKDPDGNTTEIYIDYGDSKRLIELGSGMEKMVSSLAIRVALQNASSLPRPDFIIIDEGFGTLDETNVEACNRLLVSLKRWFKHVIVISHVDGIKDITDNVIEIARVGKDSRVELD